MSNSGNFPPSDWLPGLTDINEVIVRDRTIAIAIRHVAAYPGGFSFWQAVRTRRPLSAFSDDMMGRLMGAQGLEVTARWESLSGSAIPALTISGVGDDISWHSYVWIPQLPPAEPVWIDCDWPRHRIHASLEISGLRLSEAAAIASPIWPGNEEQPF
jgi:hypothetical protein